MGRGKSTEKEEGVRAAGTLKKPKHGRAVVIGLDHPSGLAECLVGPDCFLLIGPDA